MTEKELIRPSVVSEIPKTMATGRHALFGARAVRGRGAGRRGRERGGRGRDREREGRGE